MTTDQHGRYRAFATGKMTIVLEGPDFAGKSTLAKRIVEHHLARNRSAGVVHNGPPPADLGRHNSLVDYYVDQVLHPAFDVTVLDRHAAGELIYGPRYRGRASFGSDGYRLITSALLHAGTVCVFVDQPDEVLLERFRGERGDDVVRREEDLLAIAREYREALGGDPAWERWEEVEEKVMW